MCVVFKATDLNISATKKDAYLKFAAGQMDYITNKTGRR